MAAFRAWFLDLSQYRKNNRDHLSQRARRKQAESTNGVLIPLRDVLAPTINEFFKGAAHFYPTLESLVFGPKSHPTGLH
jgi:hypothetical protein